jgi:hypothetical protein
MPLQQILLASAVKANRLPNAAIADVWGKTLQLAANVTPEFCLVYQPKAMVDPRHVGLVDAYDKLDQDELLKFRLQFPLLAIGVEMALGKISRGEG